MSRSAEQILEFDRLRDLLRARTTSAPGRRAVDALAFSTDRSRLEREFAAIAEAVSYLRAGSELGFGALANPESWLERLEKPDSVLAPGELLEVASLIATSAWLAEVFRDTSAKFPLLTERACSVASFRALDDAIRRAILPNGEVSDDASADLRRIRGSLVRARETIQDTLQRILRARDPQPGEDYVTRRNDRFVIPVRASERRTLQGVVHASSATGQTVFVEPLETLDLNNRLVQLAEEETSEIARILGELTKRVAAERAALLHAVATIADLDSLFARARFAREFERACRPFRIPRQSR